jgi:8-amino-7-oxononanoate synthase
LVRQYLINYARTLIYTTAPPTSSLAGIKVVYDYLKSNEAEERRQKLKSIVQYTYENLQNLCRGQQVPPALLRLNHARPSSPILPIYTLHPRTLSEYCQESGYIIRAIVAPTVPVGKERVRICLHAHNTEAEVQGLVKTIGQWVEQQIQKARL